jgi:chemotaxis methyl-accepting protein methylase
MRRVARRMRITKQETFSQYYQYLQANAEEARELFNDFTNLGDNVLPRPPGV